jgi:hypothetical protein
MKIKSISMSLSIRKSCLIQVDATQNGKYFLGTKLYISIIQGGIILLLILLYSFDNYINI